MSEPTGATGVALTPSDLKILAAAFKHSQTPLKPDYKLMAAELGYGNVNSASNAWSKISKKILGADVGPSPRKAAALKKTAGKKERQESDEDEDEEKQTPRKKRKATKSRYITRDETEEKEHGHGMFDEDVGFGKEDEFRLVKEEDFDDA